MSTHKPVLGKGLASLLPPPVVQSGGADAMTTFVNPAVNGAQPIPAPSAEVSNRDRIPGISMAVLDEITINPYQPRREFDAAALEELAQSIRTNGIIQPLVVRKSERGYQLIAGERRMRAAKIAGLKQVPVVIRRSTDREALEIALIENIQRQNLNCVDEALAYFQLMQDFSLTQEEMAQRAGKDRATVANFLRLLRLPEIIMNDLKAGTLSFGHGKVLAGVEDPEKRMALREEIVQKQLSVRDTEARADALKGDAALESAQPGAEKSQNTALSPSRQRLQSLGQELTRHWSTRIEIKGSERRGKIVVHYSTRQDLDRILEAMQTETSG